MAQLCVLHYISPSMRTYLVQCFVLTRLLLFQAQGDADGFYDNHGLELRHLVYDGCMAILCCCWAKMLDANGNSVSTENYG